MTDRLAILHIGVTKTGTSSIQAWLAANRGPLAAAGFHVPVSLGRQNHERLAHIAEGRAPAHLVRRFEAEMAALPDAACALVLTSEAFGARLIDAATIAPLKALLDRHVAAYRVVVYLRRQDQHAVSRFSTAMRAGEVRPKGPLSGRPLDYAALLDAWAAVFGQDAIRPRIFDRDDLKDGNVVADFLETAGIPPPESATAPIVERNTSLRPEAQAFLTHLAAHARRLGVVGEDFRDVPNREALIAALDRRFAGPGLLPARAEAMAFYDRCRATNERVRAAWFPQRDTLFSEDFSRYPEAATPPPSPEAIFEVALSTVLDVMMAGTPPRAPSGQADPERLARRAAREARIAARAARGAA